MSATNPYLLSLGEMFSQIRRAIFDPDKRYWTNQEVLDGINDGRRVLYTMKPRVYEVTEAVTLIAGHRQTVPNDSTFLFAGIDNITAPSKRGITPIDMELLTRVRPRWRTESRSNEIAHLMYVETRPTVFEVYPPAKPGTQIRISYARRPIELTLADLDTDVDTPVLLLAERAEAGGLIDYATHRCLLKEADSSPEQAGRSEHYKALAIQKFSGESSGKAKSNPNVTSIGGQAPKVNQ